jgi:hypothetical protein
MQNGSASRSAATMMAIFTVRCIDTIAVQIWLTVLIFDMYMIELLRE